MLRLPIIACVVACVLTYFICGIPFGLIVASVASGVDVRKVGSGNIGTTNVLRAAGKGAGALTLLLDAAKGFICVFGSSFAFSAVLDGAERSMFAPAGNLGWMCAWVYAACIVGHIFSCYLGFRGGKGIAVGLGGALGINWQWGLAMLAVFIVVVAVTRYVSLGSICAAASLPVFSILMLHAKPAFLVPACAVAAIVIWAHRENIGRLIRGEEFKFGEEREEA